MKNLTVILSLVFLFSGTANAQNKHASRVNPIEFLETLVNPDIFHPDNKRDPVWKERNLTHLTIEPMKTKFTLDEIKELLKGTWRTLFHCNGAPYLPQKPLFDKKTTYGYLEKEFDGEKVTRYEIDSPVTKIKKAKYDKQSYEYEVADLNEGKFELTISGFIISKNTMTPVYLKEAKTPALLIEAPGFAVCPDGSDLQFLEVRVDLPTM